MPMTAIAKSIKQQGIHTQWRAYYKTERHFIWVCQAIMPGLIKTVNIKLILFKGKL